jgi:hypothetical protein
LAVYLCDRRDRSGVTDPTVCRGDDGMTTTATTHCPG